jgi:hypothetical protein
VLLFVAVDGGAMVIKKLVFVLGFLVCSCSIYGSDRGSSEEYVPDVVTLQPGMAVLPAAERSDDESNGGQSIDWHGLHAALERHDLALQEMIASNNAEQLSITLGIVERLTKENSDLKKRERFFLMSALFGMTFAVCSMGAALFSILNQQNLMSS